MKPNEKTWQICQLLSLAGSLKEAFDNLGYFGNTFSVNDAGELAISLQFAWKKLAELFDPSELIEERWDGEVNKFKLYAYVGETEFMALLTENEWAEYHGMIAAEVPKDADF